MAKEAFCLIMWLANGGDTDSDGNPCGPPVEALCKKAEDCANCEVMQKTLEQRALGTTYLWICPDCINEALANSKEWDISVQAPGYFTSGMCQRPQCRRASDDPLTRFSNFLQLLIITGDKTP